MGQTVAENSGASQLPDNLANKAVREGKPNVPNDDRAQVPILTPPPEPAQPVTPPSQVPLPRIEIPSQIFQESPTEQFRRYRLGIGDTINVNVPRFPDLNFQGVINIEGEVTAPLLGKVQLAGLTVEAAEARLEEGFNQFVVNPDAIVTLAGTRAAQVTIAGEVVRPGYYALPPGSQLSAALLTAGGTTNVADLRSIVVRRRSPVTNAIIEQQVDIFTPLQNGTSLPELRLQDGDAVIVSKLEVGTTEDYDRQLVSRSSVAQQQITVRVLSYAGGGLGNLNLPNGSTFVDALTAISPNLDNARLRSIALIRFDPEKGRAVTQELDGKSALMGDVSQNVPLQQNDVIVVGRNLIGRITFALNSFTRPFRDILGFLLFFDELQDSASDLFGPGGDDDDD
jgi:polysaccharide export outer membrane protein